MAQELKAAKPAPIFPTADQVPEELRSLRRWLAFRLEWDEAKEKWRKPPYSPVTGLAIGAVEKYAADWLPFEEALEGVKKFELSGVGFVFVEADGYVGIDFDNCRVDGVIHPEVLNWLKWLPTYLEVSPSGTGIHAIAKGKIARALTSTELPGAGGARLEAYNQGRYFTFTGQRIGETLKIADCQTGIEKLLLYTRGKVDAAPVEVDRPMTALTAKKIHADNLETLRNAPHGAGNATLNTVAFFAARAVAVLEGGEAAVKKQLFDIVTKEWTNPHDSSSARATIESGWNSGSSKPLKIQAAIVFGPRLLTDAVRESEGILAGLSPAKYYETDRRLILPTYARELRETPGIGRDKNSVVIEDASPEMLRRDLDLNAVFVSPTSNVEKPYRPILPPFEIPRHLLDRVRLEASQVPYQHLDMAVNSPVFLPDGEIHRSPGELINGVLLKQGPDEYFVRIGIPPSMELTPSRHEAAMMLKYSFRPLFEAFPFKKTDDTIPRLKIPSGFDRKGAPQQWYETPSFAVVLAGILSLIARPKLLHDAIPMFCVSSPRQRTGKTHVVNAIAIVSCGHKPTTVTFSDEEEFAKALLPILLAQDRAVLIDNVDSTLRSAKLSMCITGNRLSDRILGKSQTVDLRNRGVFFATGNNLNLASDLAYRALLVRLDANVERPEQRAFDFNPEQRAYERHPSMLAAALIALRAFAYAGYPWLLERAPLGGFENWDKLISGCIVWLGYHDPVSTRDDIIADDPVRTANVALLKTWYSEFEAEPISIKSIERNLGSETRKLLLQRGEWDSRQVGWLLRRLRDRVEGGLKLEKATGPGGSDRDYWRVTLASSHAPESEMIGKSEPRVAPKVVF